MGGERRRGGGKIKHMVEEIYAPPGKKEKNDPRWGKKEKKKLATSYGVCRKKRKTKNPGFPFLSKKGT